MYGIKINEECLDIEVIKFCVSIYLFGRRWGATRPGAGGHSAIGVACRRLGSWLAVHRTVAK